MALRNLPYLWQIVRRHQRDWDPSLLGGRPQPVHRAVGHPIGLVRLGERITQAEHAWPAFPGIDQRAVLRLVEREITEDPEAVRVFGCRFLGYLPGVRVP